MKWEEIQFRDYLDIILGGTPNTSNPNYWNGNIPWVSVVDFPDTKRIFKTEKYITELGLEKSNTKLLGNGDIILSARGTVGKVVMCGIPMAFNQSSYALRTKYNTKLLQDFLYYLTKNIINQLRQNAVGGVFDTIIKKTIENITTKIPPLPIQRKIASILSAYDDLIENNLNRIKLLEESAETFYKFYFDFFNPSIKDNNLPKGWFVKLADEIFDIKIGKTPPREQNQWFNQADDGVKWISVKDINNTSVFILNTSETLSQESLNKFNINIVKEYTVILSFKLTVGKVAITTGDMVTNEAIAHFNIIDNTFMNTEYIYFYLKLFPYDILGSTSSIGNAINSKVVKSMPILVPDKNTINKFQKIVRPFFSQIKNLIIQNNILREARDILLPKLMYNESDLLKNI